MSRIAVISLLLGCAALGCRDRSDSPAPPTEKQSQPKADTRPAEETTTRSSRFVLALGRRLDRIQQHLTDADEWRTLGSAVLSAAEETLRRLASDPKLHLSAGRAAMERGETVAALRRFRRAAELAPEDPDTWRHLGLVHTAAGNHAEAAEAYRRVVALAPQDRTARYNLAVALSRLGQLSEAERTYEQLLADHPTYVEARYNLATLLQSRGRRHEALEHWRKITEQRPGLASAHSALGEVLTDLGRDNEAMEAFAEAAKCEPDSPTAWANLAFSAESTGSFGRAVVAARRAREAAELSHQPDAELLAELGDLLLRMHRQLDDAELLAEAVACWRGSLSQDADQPELIERVELYGRVTSQPSAVAGD
ncbi:MAG: tetratricopeptide repeat protein [Phycisphaerae bacterium]